MLEKILKNNLVRGTLVALTLAASTPAYTKPISLRQPSANSPYHLHLDSQLEREILLAANGQKCPPGLEHLPECQGAPAPAYVPPPSAPSYQPPASSGKKPCPPGLEHLPECQQQFRYYPAPASTPSPASRPSPSEPVYHPSPRNFSAPPKESSSKGLGWGFLGAGVLIGSLGLLISTYSAGVTTSDGRHSETSGKYIGYGIAGIGGIGIIIGIYHLAK